MIAGSPKNVKDFGAVGDGSTDDTSAFVAAIAGGGDIVLPAGTYFLADTSLTALTGGYIVLPTGTKIYGESKSNVTIKSDIQNNSTHAERTLFYIDADNVEIGGITFDFSPTFSAVTNVNFTISSGTPVIGNTYNFTNNTAFLAVSFDGTTLSTTRNLGTAEPSASGTLDGTPDLDYSAFSISPSVGVQKVITATQNADNLLIDDIRIQNVYSPTYLRAIAVNVGAENYNLRNIDFTTMNVNETAGSEGGQIGSMRGIYVGYNDVGTDPLADLGYGRIENIHGKDMTPFRDTDLIQVISNSGTSPYSHYSPIIIRNIAGINVGKRIVKSQVNGVSIEDVYADATGIPDNSRSYGYMFAIVAALNGKTTVRNVRGKGKFKVGIEAKDETYIEDVTIESDYTSGSVPTNTSAFILYEGGKDNRGTLKLSNMHTRGYWRQGVLVRDSGGTAYGPTKKILIDGFYTDSGQVDYSVGIFAKDQSGQLDYVRISNSVFGTLSDGNPAITTTSNAGSGDIIELIDIENVLIRGASTSVVGVDLRSKRVNINNLVDESEVQNTVQMLCPLGGVLNGIKDFSGASIAKRLANISSSNNVRITNGYSPTSTTNAYRITGTVTDPSNNIHLSENITKTGITLTVIGVTSTNNHVTNLVAVNNYTFA